MPSRVRQGRPSARHHVIWAPAVSRVDVRAARAFYCWGVLTGPRLRQVALVAHDCGRVARPGTTAGRYLQRRGGDGGYMAIFQVPGLAAARRRLAGLGVRVVWTADLPDIAATHLHPKDVPGAIVSLDWAAPAQSWRWAGPSWTGRAPEHSGGGVRGLTIEVNDPPAAARRWAAVLGIAATGGGQATVVELPDSGQWLRFVPSRAARGEGITAISIAGLAGGGPWMIGGIRFAGEEG